MDKDYNIYDGAHVETNCTDINRAQFSYNNAVFLLGAAHMYNMVGDSTTQALKMACTDLVLIRRPRAMCGSSESKIF